MCSLRIDFLMLTAVEYKANDRRSGSGTGFSYRTTGQCVMDFWYQFLPIPAACKQHKTFDKEQP